MNGLLKCPRISDLVGNREFLVVSKKICGRYLKIPRGKETFEACKMAIRLKKIFFLETISRFHKTNRCDRSGRSMQLSKTTESNFKRRW